MKYLLSPQFREVLAAHCRHEPLFAFDFDGTLAPLVAEPSQARLTAKTRELLRRLAARAPVAVISGRALPDLRDRLQFDRVMLVGNHGAETDREPRVAGRRARGTVRSWTRILARALPQAESGILLENKGISLSLHYRHSASRSAARRRIADVIGRLRPPPRVIRGKAVFNLVPEGLPHKGEALHRLRICAGAGQVLYIGDDETDEDVFAHPDGRTLGVRVGASRHSRAPYYLRRQTEVNALLEELLRLLPSPSWH